MNTNKTMFGQSKMEDQLYFLWLPAFILLRWAKGVTRLTVERSLMASGQTSGFCPYILFFLAYCNYCHCLHVIIDKVQFSTPIFHLIFLTHLGINLTWDKTIILSSHFNHANKFHLFFCKGGTFENAIDMIKIPIFPLYFIIC